MSLRKQIADADALLIATPEYNHTIPGVMGNAIDWLSRRLPTSPLRDKPIAILGAAGGGGSVRAQAALRVPLPRRRGASGSVHRYRELINTYLVARRPE